MPSAETLDTQGMSAERLCHQAAEALQGQAAQPQLEEPPALPQVLDQEVHYPQPAVLGSSAEAHVVALPTGMRLPRTHCCCGQGHRGILRV